MKPAFPARLVTLAAALLPAALLAPGCLSTMTDARLVGRGNVEITPHYSSVSGTGGGRTDRLADSFGAQMAVGVHERGDLLLSYTRVEAVRGVGGVNFASVGIKAQAVPDRFAIGLPVSFAFGRDVGWAESFLLHPTGLVTIPLSPTVDFNPAVRAQIPLHADGELLLGFNAGFGITSASRRVTVRPEVGCLVNPGETGVMWSAGASVSVRTRR